MAEQGMGQGAHPLAGTEAVSDVAGPGEEVRIIYCRCVVQALRFRNALG